MAGLILAGIVQAQTAPAPSLRFTDLVSGPATGNSDNSQPGQVAGQDGVIVTVWGKYLGTTPGQILVGGQSARIYSWANADHNSGPADLYTRHKMQIVSFQIPHTVATGSTTIQAVVGGVVTNALPFTVRPGHIYYVKTTGSDSGTGSWSSPWRSLSVTMPKLFAGDTVYAGNGVQQTAQNGDRSTMNLEYGLAGQFSTQSMPKAIVAYPGASVLIGNTAYDGSFSNYVGEGFGNFDNAAMYWTLSKLTLTGANDAAPLGSGFRLVGSFVTAPLGNAETGAISGFGNNLFILGNEVTAAGYVGTSKLYHPIYVQSTESSTAPRLPTESNREIAYNYLHDNGAYDGINIYRENTYSAFMTNHNVHDNYIINQPGAGILIGGYVTGQNWFFNNIIVNAGAGPEPTDGDDSEHACVRLEAGWIPVETGVPVPTTIHFYNNSLYNCGFPGAIAYPGTSGTFLYVGDFGFSLDLRNNLIHAGPKAQAYVPSDSEPLPSSLVSNNLWFGAGAAPSVDRAAVNRDPMLVSPSTGDLHLQTGSPAIAAGSSQTPVPPIDFDSVARPQNGGYAIGAYEYNFGTAGPPPPLPFTITTTSLANGTAGVAYSQTLQAVNGATPYTWTVSSGALPAGLNLGASNGVISGTPGAGGTSTFTVQVVDTAAPIAIATQSLSLTIGGGALPPSYAGNLDGVSCQGVVGWAANTNLLNQSITVSILDGSTVITTINANLSRPDVGSFLGDNGLHGFSYSFAGGLASGTHTIHAVYATSSTNLGSSPVTVNCGSTGAIYAGNVDAATCNGVVGWVANRSTLNQPIVVTLWSGGTQIASMTANISRPDVGAAIGDNGLHGFSMAIPAAYKNGASHTFQVEYASSGVQVLGSPFTLTCNGSTSGPSFTGFVDQTACNGIVGWAADLSTLNQSITVSLWLGATQVTTTTANLSRPDVGAVLGDNGLHGYLLTIPSAYQNGTAQSYQVRFGTTATQLSGSPVTLTCGPTAPNYAGYVDHLTCSAISGWSANLNALNTSIIVGIYNGTTLLGTVLAHAARPDVGLVLGDNGLHGFSIPTPAALLNGQAHTVTLVPAGSNYVLAGQQSLSCQ